MIVSRLCQSWQNMMRALKPLHQHRREAHPAALRKAMMMPTD
jgi:hypothetical protein